MRVKSNFHGSLRNRVITIGIGVACYSEAVIYVEPAPNELSLKANAPRLNTVCQHANDFVDHFRDRLLIFCKIKLTGF
jgi:hypothetical protein